MEAQSNMISQYDPIDILFYLRPKFTDPDLARDNSVNYKPHLFTSDELDELEQENEHKLDKLFFLLKYKNKNPNDFMRPLQKNYDFLFDEWQVALKKPFIEDLDEYRSCIRNSQIPKNRDNIVHRLEYVWTIQRELKKLTREKYLILVGDIGHGKETLALDAIDDYLIARHMGFKMYWLSLRSCKTPEHILEKLLLFKTLINDNSEFSFTDDTKTNIIRLKMILQNTLSSKTHFHCLLVLCGVENIETIDAFDLNCKILVTTRHKNITNSIPDKMKKEISIKKGLSIKESHQLFERIFKRTKIAGYERKNLEIVHSYCNGQPFIMTMVFKSLASLGRREGLTNEDEWKNWINSIQKTKIDIDATIKTSLETISEKDQEYYKQFVIFPHNVPIAINVIQKYWRTDISETKRYIEKLSNASLLQVDHDMDNIICSIDYANHNYLQIKVSAEEKQRLHAYFLENYNLDNIFVNRSEPRQIALQDNGYIFYFIGYHIQQSGRVDLFPKLYFDLGFLESLLRATKLPNTVGDLRKYETEIIEKNPENEQILDELFEFLPVIEEIIFKSTDVCLTQCALSFGVKLKELAIKQASMFQNRFWMEDIDHTDKLHQIIHLQKLSKPVLLKIYSANQAIVALEDNTMIIQDFSPFQFVEPVIYRGHKSEIINIIILTKQCFISLDKSGTVLTWEIRGNETQHNQLYSRIYSPQKSREDFACIQEFSNVNFISISTIVSHSKTYAYIGLKTDEVWIYEFNNEISGGATIISRPNLFKIRSIHNLPITHISRILNFTLFNNNEYLLLINQTGELNVRFMLDESEVDLNGDDMYQPDKLINIHKCYNLNNAANFVVVLQNEIKKITFRPLQNKARILGFQHSKVNFNSTVFSDPVQINCSHLMEKRNCLILGTQNGFKILDIDKEYELYREHVSDSIKSIDSLMLDNRRNAEMQDEFIISSCTEKSKEIIYVYKMTIPSMNTIGSSSHDNLDSTQIVMEGGTVEWFAGGQLYDIFLDNSLDDFILYAVDCNRIIHKSLSTNEYKSSIKKFNKVKDNKIIFTSASQNKFFVAYDDKTLCSFNGITGYIEDTVEQFDHQISYLKALNDNVFVVGTVDSMCTIYANSRKDAIIGDIVDVFQSTTEHLVLVFKKFVMLYSINDGIDHESNDNKILIKGNIYAVLATLHKNFLYVLSSKCLVTQYKIDDTLEEQTIILMENLNNTEIAKKHIKCFVVYYSKIYETHIYAFGLNSGKIKLIISKPNELPKPYTIETNTTASISQIFLYHRINERSTPILIAISDQITFYNCRKYLNDSPLQRPNSYNDSLRQSQRFSKRHRFSVSDIENGNMVVGDVLHSRLPKNDVMCCIKLIGNTAGKFMCNKNFNKFLTMDNEGNVYYLRQLTFNNENVSCVTENGLKNLSIQSS